MSYFCPDPGLALLASVLRDKGYSVRILDFNTTDVLYRACDPRIAAELAAILGNGQQLDINAAAKLSAAASAQFFERVEGVIYNELRYEIGSNNNTIVGAKGWLGQSLRVTCNVLQRLKQEKLASATCLGGPAVSSIGKDILAFVHGADFITIGDGEEAIISIAQCVAGRLGKDQIENTWFFENGVFGSPTKTRNAAISTLLPCYDPDVYGGVATEKLGLFMLEDSRGCSFGCPFCAHPTMSGVQYRTHTAEHLATMMERMNEQYDATSFRLTGSSPSPKLINGMAKVLAKFDRHFNIGAFMNLHFVERLELPVVRGAGFKAFLLGIESVDAHNLKYFLGEKHNVAFVRKTLKFLRESNIFCALSFIFPQLNNDYSEFERFVTSYPLDKDSSSIVCSFPNLFPGTAWWREPERFEIKFDDRRSYLRSIVLGEELVGPRLLQFKIKDRGMSTLWEEYYTAKRIAHLADILLDVSDEVALLAIGSGLKPRDFRRREEFWINTYSIAQIDKFRRYIDSKLRPRIRTTGENDT